MTRAFAAAIVIALSAAGAAPARAQVRGDATSCAHVVNAQPSPDGSGGTVNHVFNSCFQAIRVTLCTREDRCETQTVAMTDAASITTSGAVTRVTAQFQ